MDFDKFLELLTPVAKKHPHGSVIATALAKIDPPDERKLCRRFARWWLEHHQEGHRLLSTGWKKYLAEECTVCHSEYDRIDLIVHGHIINRSLYRTIPDSHLRLSTMIGLLATCKMVVDETGRAILHRDGFIFADLPPNNNPYHQLLIAAFTPEIFGKAKEIAAWPDNKITMPMTFFADPTNFVVCEAVVRLLVAICRESQQAPRWTALLCEALVRSVGCLDCDEKMKYLKDAGVPNEKWNPPTPIVLSVDQWWVVDAVHAFNMAIGCTNVIYHLRADDTFYETMFKAVRAAGVKYVIYFGREAASYLNDLPADVAIFCIRLFLEWRYELAVKSVDPTFTTDMHVNLTALDRWRDLPIVKAVLSLRAVRDADNDDLSTAVKHI